MAEITPEMLNKLPRWAQGIIYDLERELYAVVRTVNTLLMEKKVYTQQEFDHLYVLSVVGRPMRKDARKSKKSAKRGK